MALKKRVKYPTGVEVEYFKIREEWRKNTDGSLVISFDGFVSEEVRRKGGIAYATVEIILLPTELLPIDETISISYNNLINACKKLFYTTSKTKEFFAGCNDVIES